MTARSMKTMTLGAAYAGDNRVAVTPLARTTSTIAGQPIVLPQDGPEVTAAIFEIPPKTRMPAHRHPHPRYGYILSGRLRVTNVDTGVVSNFSEGDFVVESYLQWHVGENPGDTPLKLLVIDQTPAGVSNIESQT